jgi:GTP-binding protein YchF
MRLGIIGLPGSGRSTIFQVLIQGKLEDGFQKGPRIATVRVPDTRVESLSEVFKPEKTVYAQLEYLFPSGVQTSGVDGQGNEAFWNEVRPCDALVHVIRNFHQPGGEPPNPRDDYVRLETDMIFADLVVVERRIERLDLDRKRGKEASPEELGLLQTCRKTLEEEKPLRDDPELAGAPLLRGYAFLSAKPVLVLFNNDDEEKGSPSWEEPPKLLSPVVVRGKLEMELAELSDEEAGEFLTAYQIDRSAVERVIQHSCGVLGLITFFTVIHKEVRAWMIPRGTKAIDAAGVIHSDMQRGFIRAEVVGYDDLMIAGTYQQAKKEGLVRLEGKDHAVQDGDIIQFHFNV